MSKQRVAPQPLPPGAAPLFNLGQVLFTPPALDLLMELDIDHYALLKRHISCTATSDCADDQARNIAAARTDERVFSSFVVATENAEPIKLWIITEADRSSTTILLPSDY